MQTFDPWDGALLIDKPAGPTSHDVVARIRHRFNLKKVGHSGTLDPAATGLLILLLGRGTKLSDKMMAGDKGYEGQIKFGISTGSYDAQGSITSERPVPELSVEQLNQLTSEFVGDHLQVPPMVSAIKLEGVPLYKLARKGVEVERKPRLIHIYQYQFSEYHNCIGTFKVRCTKGTYVRSLAHDLGEKIGCGAHLFNLRRTLSGRFSVQDALPLSDALSLSWEGLLARVIPLLQLGESPLD